MYCKRFCKDLGLIGSSFADIHYFYGPPTAKPPHHSFDKSSYVYLYHNPIAQRGRLEIANNAGTPDQTAFSGGELSLAYNTSVQLS
jgi:hypothetical protein